MKTIRKQHQHGVLSFCLAAALRKKKTKKTNDRFTTSKNSWRCNCMPGFQFRLIQFSAALFLLSRPSICCWNFGDLPERTNCLAMTFLIILIQVILIKTHLFIILYVQFPPGRGKIYESNCFFLGQKRLIYMVFPGEDRINWRSCSGFAATCERPLNVYPATLRSIQTHSLQGCQVDGTTSQNWIN